MSITRSICLLLLSISVVGNILSHGDDQQSGPENRLAGESSPYLLLHAHNPVDWYPWGAEAFEKARQEGKPIFLSIGYSSCYWCHVMERKVFTDGAIAKYMNENFVNIKVDREERPDVDDIYMTALIVYQQMAGSPRGGGWPLSMFLTPDGNPIGGATYLPPVDSAEQGPGFLTVATRVSTLWDDRRDDLTESAATIAREVQRLTRPTLDLENVALDSSLLDVAVDRVRQLYDPVWGGVDFDERRPNSPRFPNVPRLELALDRFEATDDAELLKIVEHSLEQMARGGIRDHLGGGFHRYSTDRQWHVPHFEKMLYDQAQLLGVYAHAAQLTGKPLYGEVAAEIADFVHREMTTDRGGFCSALDAETNAVEGEYYVWSVDEVTAILGTDDAKVFGSVYGFDRPNTFEHGFVLHQSDSLADSATKLNIDLPELERHLLTMRQKLLAARSKREYPLLDDKVLTAWNSMMIRSLAYSGRVLNRPQDIAAAGKAADFLLTNLRDDKGQLLRTWRLGAARYQAYLNDYSYLVAALLELHRSTAEARWLAAAGDLSEQQNDLFYDENLRAYYFTANNHEKLIARTSSVYDSVFPSANSVSVCNLLRLNELTPSAELKDMARKILTRFAPTLKKAPGSCSGLARSLQLWLRNSPAATSVQSRADVGGLVPQIVLTSIPRATAADDSGQELPAVSAEEPIEQTTFRPVLPAKPAGPLAPPDKEKPLKVKIYPMYGKLPEKGKCLIAIELQVKDGWHINANPSSPDFLVPTTVELKSKQKVKLTKVKFPKHHVLKVQGFDEPYHVYDGNMIVYGLLEIEEPATSKTAELEFHVRFQGCNSSQCLAPDLVVMKGKLPLAKAGEELKKINVEKFPKPKTTDRSEDPNGFEKDSPRQK